MCSAHETRNSGSESSDDSSVKHLSPGALMHVMRFDIFI